MKMFQIVSAVVLMAFSCVSMSSTADAASAHNSQAGANGDTSNNSAPISQR